MSPTRRVVVTGLGAVTPVGHDVASFWSSCLEGRTGTRRLEHEWLTSKPDAFRTRLGAPVVGFDSAAAGFTPRDMKTLDVTSRYAIAATREALETAGFGLDPVPGKSLAFTVGGLDRDRAATVVGSGTGGLSSIEAVHSHWVRNQTLRGAGFLRQALPMYIPNSPAANVSIRFGLRGECKAISTACAAGTMAVGDGFRIVRDGEADVAVVGGAEVVLSTHDGLGLITFDVLGVMSTREDDAAHASRPFDEDRDGFVLGEGAGVLVLEELAHARARGAEPLAEVVSYASTCDATNMMQPDPVGAMVAHALRLAIERAGREARDVDHVNAHGTATLAGDPVEAEAIRSVLGSGDDAPLVSATKSLTGHCIGASGGMEAVATVKSITDGRVHPTANLENVAEGCELRHVVGAPERCDVGLALSASYGFGGHDAVVALAAHE